MILRGRAFCTTVRREIWLTALTMSPQGMPVRVISVIVIFGAFIGALLAIAIALLLRYTSGEYPFSILRGIRRGKESTLFISFTNVVETPL